MGEKIWPMREVHNGEASDDDVNGSASRLSEEPCVVMRRAVAIVALQVEEECVGVCNTSNQYRRK